MIFSHLWSECIQLKIYWFPFWRDLTRCWDICIQFQKLIFGISRLLRALVWFFPIFDLNAFSSKFIDFRFGEDVGASAFNFRNSFVALAAFWKPWSDFSLFLIWMHSAQNLLFIDLTRFLYNGFWTKNKLKSSLTRLNNILCLFKNLATGSQFFIYLYFYFNSNLFSSIESLSAAFWLFCKFWLPVANFYFIFIFLIIKLGLCNPS